ATALPSESPTPAALPPAAERQRPSAPTRAPRRLPRLDITSDPPGARVFLDDEPVGRTDPETGRLRLRELAPGRHRLRLSSEGRADVIREIDIATDSVAVAVALPPRPAPASPAPPPTEPRPRTRVPVALVVAVGVLAFLVFGLWMWRQARPPTQAPAPGATPRSGEGRKDSGTDESFPILFGEYSLVRRIGKGGMAVVYEATRRGESFALKRPLSGFLDDDRYRERFMREAELGRTLHHPNIIRIFDRGQVGDIPYFVMELIRGETLRAHLDRDGRLDATLAARLTAQVAEALDYAHNKGVIHRDLKPSNIMLEQSGGVKVMDYGVARAQQQEGLTTTGSFLGTPSYAAPETVDAGTQPQSDLYSLGVVLFEMLTGSLPFRGDSAFAILRNHATTPPPAPSSLNYALPEALDRLVLRLLSKEPSDRPTAEELLNELADFLGATR
ncbi:MAG: protein kinase, partial [Acidobacteriota bacterium]